MAKRPGNTDAAKTLAIQAARLASDSHCEDIVVLDLRGISPVTDYFVIATGTSSRQMRSVADDIAKFGKSIGQPAWQKAGMDSSQWVLLDFVDLVVHLFDSQARGYYDLELMWGEAPHVEWARES
ncbi:MAG: ribosome silencing factor [Phycisphaerae bacterium]|jgi:ribosome-associated protein|nr:ribosome silencing factor [Phycisphaerae bacterium]